MTIDLRDEEYSGHGGVLEKQDWSQYSSDRSSFSTRKWIRRGALFFCGALAFYLVSRPRVSYTSTATTLSPSPAATYSQPDELLYHGSNGWTSFNNLFAFGDSYTSYNKEYREDDPPFKCMMLSDGDKFKRKPNWITFLTEVYNTTEVTSVDFAEGGSTVDRDVIPPFAMGWSLKEEVQAFLRSYSFESPSITWQPETSLFVFWFGINDITMPHTRSVPGEPFDRPPLPKVFESYSSSVKKVYDAGARNFLFMAVPPFDRSLKYPADEWHAKRQQATIADITDFNSRLFEMWAQFRQNHSDVTAHLFDSHRFYSRMISEPTAFPGTAHVTNTLDVCLEAIPAQQPGPLDIVYDKNICVDGSLIQSYIWTELHSTYPVNNATAWQVVKDCFTGGATKGYCH